MMRAIIHVVMIHVVMIHVQCMSVSEDAGTVGVIKKFTPYYSHCTDAHTFFDEKTMEKYDRSVPLFLTVQTH